MNLVHFFKSDNIGRTALHCAVIGGYIDVIRILVTHGSDVCAQTLKKTSPLHAAVSANRDACVVLLLEIVSPEKKAIMLALTDSDGKSALDLAIEAHCKVICQLLRQGDNNNSAACSIS